VNAIQIDRKFQHPRLKASGAADLACLSRSEIMAIEHVINEHGRKGFDELKALTHSMAAYQNAWAKAKAVGSKMEEMRYEDFFEDDSDAVAGALEEMLENDSLRKALQPETPF
jgi:hypothetical protein